MDRDRSGKPLIRKIAIWLALSFPTLVAVVFIGQYLGIPTKWSVIIALIGWGVVARYCRLKHGGVVALGIGVIAIVGYFAHRPSHDREWEPEIAQLPRFQILGDSIKVENLRDFVWHSTQDFEARWVEASYDLNRLVAVDVIVVPFGERELAAHVMLSFGFDDGRQLVLSVESRPEIGESYSLVGGAARQLELIYLFGTEPDLLGLRIFHRGNRVYAFPLKADARFARALLLELCHSANQLLDEPKFYATLRHNCTTTLLRHVNRLRDEPIGFQTEILFPAKVGELLHRLGHLDTDLSWPKAKARYRIDERITNDAEMVRFSRRNKRL